MLVPCRRLLPQAALVAAWAACFVGLWHLFSWKAHLLVFSQVPRERPLRVSPAPTGRFAYVTLDVTPTVGGFVSLQ